MSKIKIKKNDAERVLLTELLPYEVPMLFSNEGFYSLIKTNNYSAFKDKMKQLNNNQPYGIPYDYLIRKPNNGTRKLSIIHPFIQQEFVDFYKKYSSLLIPY